VTPDEPRLWCALGDLCMDDAHYQQAWERSGHRNARWARGLGGAAKWPAHTFSSLFMLMLLVVTSCPLAPIVRTPPPSRSQRSLARSALRNSRYAQAAQHWEAALALNPLHGEGWFRCAGRGSV
jgi:hypothetical protein